MNAFRLPSVSVPKIDFAKLDVTKMSLPKVSIPKMSLPKVSLPHVTLPGLDLTHVDVRKGAERVATLSKDLAYVTVGTGVLAAQQLQVRRREVTAALQARVPEQVDKAVSSAIDAVRSRLRPPAESAE
jgi:hypothetical protein